MNDDNKAKRTDGWDGLGERIAVCCLLELQNYQTLSNSGNSDPPDMYHIIS